MNTPTAAPDDNARAGSISLEEALDRLMAAVAPFPVSTAESLPTAQALGRVLAADVVSLVDVPPGDNTSMDGYAMRAADVPVSGAMLPVSQRIPAGTAPQALVPGTAARIFTGAQVPAGQGGGEFHFAQRRRGGISAAGAAGAAVWGGRDRDGVR
jgi:molybdopterin molybdotransferase